MSLEPPRPDGASTTRLRAGLAFVLVSVFLDYMAQSISFPILPRLALHLLGGDRPTAARWVGWLEVASMAPLFFSAPVLGMISDRFGRRPVILISIFGVGAELVICALAPNIWWLLLGRMLCGVSYGGLAAATAYVADVTAPEARTRAYGWLNAAIWSGVIAGPALGGMLAAVNLRAPFWAAAVFAIAAAVYGALVLPESLPSQARTPLRWSVANPWAAVSLLARRPGLPLLAMAMLLVGLARYAGESVVVLYTAIRYGWSALAYGLFCAVLALAGIAVQTGLAGRLAARVGERATAIAGLGLQAAGFAGMGLAATSAGFWAANLPAALGAVALPALQSMMTAKVGANEQGRLQGALGTLSSLTGLVGPIAFTQLFAWSVAPGRPIGWSGAASLAGAGLTAGAVLVVLAGVREGRRRPAQ